MADKEKNTGVSAPVKKVKFSVKMKARITELISRTRSVLNQIYLGEETYSVLTKKFINAIKVFIVATRKFIKDGCTTKASSIAYTTIVSLIPTLTVALTAYSMFEQVGNKKEEIFRKITAFMLEHNIRLNIDPIMDTISSLIDNSRAIGGIGAVTMVIAATAVLRSIEQSLNDIWGITKNRPIILRMIYYWAALSLGPLMLIAGTAVATQISTTFSSPTYYTAAFTENRVWAVGNKALILSAPTPEALENVPFNTESIDFDNQRIYRFDPATKEFLDDESRIDAFNFKKSVFRSVQFIGKNGWIAGRNGIIMNTTNGGESWSLEQWGSLNFNDIRMLNPRKGFAITDNGYLLATEDGGRSWKISDWEGYSSSFNRIAFNNDNGIVTGDKGVILSTTDGGATWAFVTINEAKKKNRLMNLNNACFVDAKTAWIVGDQGVVLLSEDGGKSWKNKNFQESDYFSVYFADKKNGVIAGDGGVTVRTDDGGHIWRRSSIGVNRINSLIPKGGKLWAFGDNGIIKSSVNMTSWSGREGGSFFIGLANFFAPFIFIWLLFLLTYITFPNTKVPFKPAAIGAAFTGTVWVIFILLFIIYVRYFSGGQLAIYGALAAFPIFLLMIYASSLIVLYGAEVSYTLMHPHTYLRLKKALKDIKEFHVIYGVTILYQIYSRFESGKGATAFNELLKLTAQRSEEVEYYLTLFKKEKLVLEKDEGQYLPTNSSRNVVIADVIDLIHSVSLEIPATVGATNPVKKHMQKILNELDKSRREIVGGLTLSELIGK